MENCCPPDHHCSNCEGEDSFSRIRFIEEHGGETILHYAAGLGYVDDIKGVP